MDALEAAKRSFGTEAQAWLPQLLQRRGREHFLDAASLIRFHEDLLFFRAYPPSREVLEVCDELLREIAGNVAQLRGTGADLAPFEEPEVSGIAGTQFSAIFTYDIARWLSRHHPDAVEIDWDGYDETLLAPLVRRLHPFAKEDLLVEANIPYMDWLRAANRSGESDLEWLVARLDAELFAQAKFPIRWSLGDGCSTRTNGRFAVPNGYFYHDAPLIRRSGVSLAAELASPPFAIEKISPSAGEQFLDFTRETSAMRYRELHGFTFGDPAHVYRADLGRGVEAFVCGVPPEHRLPLRAYHAGMFFKNGVPIGYIETLTLFEHMEVGFNLYYTFREGETAWLYVRLLHLFRQLLSATCFAVDPYQLGRHNEEAIESGAFWFYRKLGFRPASQQVAKILQREERKLHANAGYRTSARTLRKLSDGWMIYEIPGSPTGDWDGFETRRAAMALHHSPFSPEIGRAKNAPEEFEYVRALQNDPELRRRILDLGSRPLR